MNLPPLASKFALWDGSYVQNSKVAEGVSTNLKCQLKKRP